ncbi:MAG TPA: hypothetical protein VGR68_06085 [Actinomycetota bacterium]|nr:hypothetical protein [Actinomycetota bacterium]
MTPAARLAQPRQWSGVVAWALWVLVVLGMAAGFWLEDLLRRAGRADPLDTAVGPTVAAVSAATVGAVLAARRPRHPVGWLLLAFALCLAANGVAGGTRPTGSRSGPAVFVASTFRRCIPISGRQGHIRFGSAADASSLIIRTAL